MALILTGATGQIGSALCQELERLEIRHFKISRFIESSSNYSISNKIDLSVANLDWNEIAKDVSGIIHLAAAVPHSPEYPDNEFSANKTQIMDANILNLYSLTQAPLVYMSTCGLYSKESDQFQTETDLVKIQSTSPYFEAKLKGEEKFITHPNTTILRLSAPISHRPVTGLVLEKMIRDIRTTGKISVYGNGSREQDFISVTDTTSAILKTMEKQTFGVYNLCSSKPVTMFSLADTLTNYLGSGSVVVGEEEDTNDGAKARYCNKKLRNVIDWNPIEDLKEMLTKMKTGL